MSVRERGRRKRGKRKEKSKEGKSVCELCISFYFCCCFVKVTVERNVQIRAPKIKKNKKMGNAVCATGQRTAGTRGRSLTLSRHARLA